MLADQLDYVVGVDTHLDEQTAATRPTSATPAPRLLSAATTSSAD
jgi:hypothetical protein